MCSEALFVLNGSLTGGTNLVLYTLHPRMPGVRYFLRIADGVPVGDLAGNLIPAGSTFPVAVFTNTVIQLDASQAWRYEQSGADLEAAWRSNTFNDAGWTRGAAPLDAFRSFPGSSPPLCRGTLPEVREPVRTEILLAPPISVTTPGETQARRLSVPVEVAKRFKKRRLALKAGAAAGKGATVPPAGPVPSAPILYPAAGAQ